ncbi:MAG TPA: sugar phosphate isomerase/epimerase family protein [Cyclobacteriaceae bacterium]
MKQRRAFLKDAVKKTAGISLMASYPGIFYSCGPGKKTSEQAAKEVVEEVEQSLFFDISLAQWSLNRSIFGKSRELSWQEFGNRLQNDPDALLQGEIDPMEFPTIAKERYGITGVEYVNTFYFSKAKDMDYLGQLKQRCEDAGVQSVLIMVDAEGSLGALDDDERKISIENHYKWVDAAKFLGCHSIRVNARGNGTADEVKSAAVQGLGSLSEYGAQNGIGIIVENHGGYSSDGKWLSDVMKQVNNEYCGTLPDFGNFCIERSEDGCAKAYDRYQGLKELMPYAKGVSAKTNVFDEQGNESNIDYKRMMQIVKDHGYTGFVGIEYEGQEMSEDEGIKATMELLKKVGMEVS